MLDLSLLPAPDIVEPLDYETLLAERKAAFLALVDPEDLDAWTATLDLESEPVVKLLQENAYRELLLRQRINEACRATMLAYAVGSDLDQIAAGWEVSRLVVTPADPDAVPPVEEVLESDYSLRRRVQLAAEALTSAGTRAAYLFHTLTSSPLVAAASVEGPELVWVDGEPTSSNGIDPGKVQITILSTDNDGEASPSLLSTVQDYVSDDLRRPLCDTVIVQACDITDYTIEAELYLYPGPAESPILEAAEAGAQAFASAHFQPGYDIRRSGIFAALHVAGVQRVELSEPAADLVLGMSEAGRCTAVTLTVGGRDV